MSDAPLSALWRTAFAVAYRMTGAPADAEDIAQEAMLRWRAVDRADVRAPAAFVARIAANLSIDHLKKAAAALEAYHGDWLPAPLADDVLEEAERDQLIYGMLVLLQGLTPLQRAVFILRSAFDCDYAEISETLGRSGEACRQAFSRARKALREKRSPAAERNAAKERLLNRLVEAIEAGDVDALGDILAEDVVLRGDGGGRAAALKRPLVGARRAIPFLLASRRLVASPTASIRRLNGQASIVLHAKGKPVLALLIDNTGECINRLFAVANPDKLTRI